MLRSEPKLKAASIHMYLSRHEKMTWTTEKSLVTTRVFQPPTGSTKLKQADLCMPLSAVPKSLHLPFAAVLALALPQNAPHRKFQLTTKTDMNPKNNNERTQTSKPRQTNDAIQRRRKQDATPQSLWYALFCTPTMEF